MVYDNLGQEVSEFFPGIFAYIIIFARIINQFNLHVFLLQSISKLECFELCLKYTNRRIKATRYCSQEKSTYEAIADINSPTGYQAISMGSVSEQDKKKAVTDGTWFLLYELTLLFILQFR